MKDLHIKAIDLLKSLISTPSISKEEDKTAELIINFFRKEGIQTERVKNNIIVQNKYWNNDLPFILLNSHHDTVKPNAGYTVDPFTPTLEGDKLIGLGSNDAGGCLVSLIATFLHFYDRKDLKYNLLLIASAEEEISGRDGIELALQQIPNPSFAVVGEPTQMNAAIAEKGLMVLDCVTKGISGHAAREEGENALYKALPDIQWFQKFEFPKTSEALGKVKMSVTVIKSGTQHNVVPDTCHFVVDVRSTDAYSNEEILSIISENVACEVTPRSTRLNSSSIDENHPFVAAAKKLGAKTYGSPTLSDQALMQGIPSLKMGPGLSARSHTADEFIYISEIEKGIDRYIEIFEAIL